MAEGVGAASPRNVKILGCLRTVIRSVKAVSIPVLHDPWEETSRSFTKLINIDFSSSTCLAYWIPHQLQPVCLDHCFSSDLLTCPFRSPCAQLLQSCVMSNSSSKLLFHGPQSDSDSLQTGASRGLAPRGLGISCSPMKTCPSTMLKPFSMLALPSVT